MYLEYFGFNRFPFTIAPDPDFLFPSAGHQEALAHLCYALSGHGGLICLTGEVGTGKTTLCRTFLAQVPDDVITAYLFNPRLSPAELLQSLCDELNIGYAEHSSDRDLYRYLYEGLLQAYSAGKRVICVIDEAQAMPAELLEQIRLLTNLETDKEKLLTLILVGQPELRALLQRHDLRQLNQRITARYHLRHLTLAETSDYLDFRTRQAGVSDSLFTPAAVRRLWRASYGVPRMINTLADRALLGAYARERKQVTPALVKGAEREIFGTAAEKPRRAASGWQLRSGLVMVVCAGLLALGWQYLPEPVLHRLLPAEDNPVALLSRERSGQHIQDCSDLALNGEECMWVDWPLSQLSAAGSDFALQVRDTAGVHWQTAIPTAGQHYTGSALLIWTPPPGYQQRLVRPGERAPLVRWVRRQLGMEWNADWQVVAPGGQTAAPDGSYYDPLLAQRVEEFQRSYGLIPDRIIGPQTLLYLQHHTSLAEGD